MPHSPAIPADLAEVVRSAVAEAMAQLPKSRWRRPRDQAERVGVSERTLRGWLARAVDPLPASRVGGAVLIHDGESDAWLRHQRLGRDADEIAAKVLASLNN